MAGRPDRKVTLHPSPRQRFTAKFGHLYPLLSGCGTMANSRLVRLVAGSPGPGPVWGQLRSGAWVLVDLNDFDGRAAFFGGDVDRKITALCRRLVKPGDVVIDVGANVGVVTMVLAACVQQSGLVISFEPNPTLYPRLRQAIERNGFANVRVEQIALGATAEERTLSIPHGHSGKGSLSRTFDGAVQVPVSIAALDEYVTSHHVNKVALLKIDVEGHEAEVLKGAQRMLASVPPDAILMEANSIGALAAIRCLRQAGYEIFGIPRSLARVRLHPLPPNEDLSCGNDVLAVMSGTHADAVALQASN